MNRNERLSYMVLFCSILAARKAHAPIAHATRRAPLSGRALRLSELLETCESEPATDSPASDLSC